MIETQKTRISPAPVFATDHRHARDDASVLADFDAGGTEVIIQPRSGWIAIDWREMIAHPGIAGILDLARTSQSDISKPFWAVLGPSCSPCS